MTRTTMPPDFPDVATRPVRELSLRYNVAHNTVLRWRKELGIRLSPGAPKGNQNGAARKSPSPSMDGPEQIRACLNCTRPRCRGQCDAVR